MATPFLGQLMPCSWSYAAKGWATCDGQLLPINQNQALFSLLGTYFGGNGIQNFALPDLRGRTPLGMGSGFNIGAAAGEAAHTLTLPEVPAHTHTVNAAVSGANSPSPANALLSAGAVSAFVPADGLSQMQASTVASFGGSQPHENQQPFLVINWCIALTGIYPTRD